ncbi:hypothetical protein [Arenicella xantha]|uniref:hypothetical protein n=1 Tax=Arenicella xantha TaxID=644221 RepID=UPI001B877236|nr:hypothetical protein [Arenicella xantha]
MSIKSVASANKSLMLGFFAGIGFVAFDVAQPDAAKVDATATADVFKSERRDNFMYET